MLTQRNNGISAFDTHVRFWGKVVDQDGNSVKGATIKAIVPTLRLIKFEGGYREYEILTAQSAADGTFMFDGADGFSLTIRQLSKDGYVLPSAYQAGTRWEGSKYSYRYKSIGDMQSVFRPDSSQPVIFHLWRINKPEPVAIVDIGKAGPKIKVGGPPTPLFSISIMVTDVGTALAPQWEVTIAALEPDGGVVKADPSDVFMFTAPESGYTHSIKFRYGPEGTDEMEGEDGKPVRFYLKCKNGRWHSAEDYAFFAPNEDGVVMARVRSWLNPSGSRNLEHDAAHPLPRPRLDE